MVTTKSLFAAEGLDERSLEFLAKAIENNNLPGFDYFEYKRAVYALQQMQLDETTAHKSAFTTATMVGLTKEKLIETAGFYRNLLAKEKEQFNTALENQHKIKITARQEEAKRLRDQVERHKIEIQRLQDEMGAYLSQIDEAEKSIVLEQERLTKTKTAFENTQQSVVLHIDGDIEKMHKYL